MQNKHLRRNQTQHKVLQFGLVIIKKQNFIF